MHENFDGLKNGMVISFIKLGIVLCLKEIEKSKLMRTEEENNWLVQIYEFIVYILYSLWTCILLHKVGFIGNPWIFVSLYPQQPLFMDLSLKFCVLNTILKGKPSILPERFPCFIGCKHLQWHFEIWSKQHFQKFESNSFF